MDKNRTINRRVKSASIVTIFAVILALAVVMTCVIAFTSKKTKAETHEMYKYYTSYEVKSGDTLWTIAEKYSGNGAYDSVTEYIDEVCSINHLPSDKIYAGNEICIPYYSAEYKQ